MLKGGQEIKKLPHEEELQVWRTYIQNFICNEVIPSMKPNPSILDIGVGESTNILKEKFEKIYVLDRRKDNVGADFCYDIEDENTANLIPKFDYVFLMEVLEHTNKPWTVANVVEKILNEGGNLIVSAPAFLFWHPMQPVCGDFWRFLPGYIPNLFPNLKLIRQAVCPDPKDHLGIKPLGICAILR